MLAPIISVCIAVALFGSVPLILLLPSPLAPAAAAAVFLCIPAAAAASGSRGAQAAITSLAVRHGFQLDAV